MARRVLFLRALAALLSGGGALGAPPEGPAPRAVVVDRPLPPGRSLKVGPGQVLEVRLKVQFGTGFSWQVRKPLDPRIEELPGRVLPAPQSDVDGGFETQVFLFRAVEPLEASLAFELRRPWEPPGEAPRSSFLLERIRFGGAKGPVHPPGP